MDLCIHSPIRLHGVVHNYISTGTTLLFTIYIAVSISMFEKYFKGTSNYV
jgi:hypothetical protein